MFDFSNGKIKELFDLFDKKDLQSRELCSIEMSIFIIDILENINNVFYNYT